MRVDEDAWSADMVLGLTRRERKEKIIVVVRCEWMRRLRSEAWLADFVLCVFNQERERKEKLIVVVRCTLEDHKAKNVC